MANIKMIPATAETGFILSMPPLPNSYAVDTALQRILKSYLPLDMLKSVEESLVTLAEEARSTPILAMQSNAEKNQPHVRTHDSWGRRLDVDQLITSEGWRYIGKWGASRGIIATGYEAEYQEYRRIVQFARLCVWGPSSAMYSCPFAMTDGAARLLELHTKSLDPSHPLREALVRLTSREDHWTSGQWMTERPGGSDVQKTETWATFSPLSKKTGKYGRIDEGDYLISGFKFFSSATDANVAVLLAKTESGKLSAFLAPLVKTIIDDQGNEKQVTNGVRIHRLKNKLGTKQLPTAELELNNMRAHLMGEVDRGVPTISVLLNITRVHTFMGAIAGLGRCLTIAKTFAKARSTLGLPLWKNHLHLRTLADLELKRRALLHLSQFTTALMGFVESGFPDPLPPGLICLPSQDGSEASIVLRVLTATAKAVCSKLVVGCIHECMEAMGGVGYIDDPDDSEYNIARTFRDIAVNSIWEGTTNVMSSELVRFILAKDNLDCVEVWLERSLSCMKDDRYRALLVERWDVLRSRLRRGKEDVDRMLADGRRVMFSLAWVVCGILLVVDGERDGDLLAMELARRWVIVGEGGVGEWVYRDVVSGSPVHEADVGSRDHADWDCRLLFGESIRGGESKL